MHPEIVMIPAIECEDVKCGLPWIFLLMKMIVRPPCMRAILRIRKYKANEHCYDWGDNDTSETDELKWWYSPAAMNVPTDASRACY